MAEPLRQKLKVEPEGVTSTFNQLRAAVGGYQSEVEGAAGKTQGLLGRIKTLATSGKALLVGTLAAGFAAVSAAIVKATSMAVGFENQLNEVRKTAGLTETEFQRLQENLLNVQAELGTSQEDLAAIAAEAGRLGIESPKHIEEFTRTVSMMADATVVSADKAAQSLGKILNAFNRPVSEAEQLASVLNELSNQTIANTADLAEFTRRASATAAQIGLTKEEVSALGATLIDAGFNARRAGTRMRVLFRRIQSNAEEVGETMGMTREKVVQAFEERGVEALQQLLSELEKLGPAARTARIEELFSGRDVQTVNKLISQSENLSTQLQTAAEEADSVTSLTEEFTATTKDVSNEWGRLTARLSSWVTSFGSIFTGVLESILSTLNDITTDAKELRRDLLDAKGQVESVKGIEGLIEDLKEARQKGEETADILGKIADQVGEEFIRRGPEGDLLGIRVDALEKSLELREEAASSNLEEKQKDSIQSLNEAYKNLQETRLRQENVERGTERWGDLQREIKGTEEKIDTLLKSLAEVNNVDAPAELRSLLQDLSEGETFASALGITDLGDMEAIESLTSRFEKLQRAGATTGGGPTNEDGEGQMSPAQRKKMLKARQQLAETVQRINRLQKKRNALTDQERQTLSDIFKAKDRVETLEQRIKDLREASAGATGKTAARYDKLIKQAQELLSREEKRLETLQVKLDDLREQRKSVKENAPEKVPSPQPTETMGTPESDLTPDGLAGPRMETVNEALIDYNNTLRDMRLELERGNMSQKEFEEAAASAAEEAKEKIKELLNTYEEEIPTDLKESAIDALDQLNEKTGESKETIEEATEKLSQMAELADGISRLGEKMGILDEQTAEAVQGLSSGLQGAESAITSFSSGNVIGGITGSVQAIGGFASMIQGDSGPGFEELKTEVRSNVDALEENTSALLESARVGEEVTEQQIEDARAIFDKIASGASNQEQLFKRLGESIEGLDGEALADTFSSAVKAMDDTLSHLDLISDESMGSLKSNLAQLILGVDPEKVFEGDDLSSDQQQLFLQQFREAVGKDFEPVDEILSRLEEGLGQFADSLEGFITQFETMQEFGGAGQEQAFSDLISNLVDMEDTTGSLEEMLASLSDVDITTEEGREQVRSVAEELTQMLAEGSINLEEMSAKKIQKIIETLTSAADASGGGGGPEETRRRQTQVQRTITEIQANELIAIEMEQLFVLRGILQSLGGEVDSTGFEPMGVGGPVELKVDQEIRDIRNAVVRGTEQPQGGEGGEGGGPPRRPPRTPPGDGGRPREPTGGGGERGRRGKQLVINQDFQIDGGDPPEKIARKLKDAISIAKRSQS